MIVENIGTIVVILGGLVLILFVLVGLLFLQIENLKTDLENKRNEAVFHINSIKEKCFKLESNFNKFIKKTVHKTSTTNVNSEQVAAEPAKPKEVIAVKSTPAQPKQTVPTSTLFLGINSQELFFETKSKKDDTTKFIAYVLNESEADFDLIDIERIRSIDTGCTVRQKGLVSLKDARSFETVRKGKIQKSQDEDGEICWVIVSPIEVEFKK